MHILPTLRAAIAVLLLAVATTTPSLASGFDYATRTGIVYLDEAGAPVLEVPWTDSRIRPLLQTGAAVNVVIVGFGGMQRLVPTKIAGMPDLVGPGDSRLHYDGATVNTTRYKLAIVGDAPLQPGAIGFGITGTADSCRTSESAVSCDLEPDGPPQFFRVCASREGLHFSVWSGKPLEGTRRWRAYYYLGYDVEPDCTDGDYSD